MQELSVVGGEIADASYCACFTRHEPDYPSVDLILNCIPDTSKNTRPETALAHGY